MQNKTLLLLPVSWLLGCAGYTLLCASPSAGFVPDLFLVIVYKLCEVLGVVSVFVLYDFLSGKDGNAGLPVLLILICVLVSGLLSRFAPKLRSFMTGGR